MYKKIGKLNINKICIICTSKVGNSKTKNKYQAWTM